MDGLDKMFAGADELGLIIGMAEKKADELTTAKREHDARVAKRKRKSDITLTVAEPVIVGKPRNQETEFSMNLTKSNWFALAAALFGKKYITVDKTELHTKADETSRSKTLNKGVEVKLIDNIGSWSKVKYIDKDTTYHGYVKSNMLKEGEISVDDALHMMGLDRKNNTSKAKEEES